MDGVEGAGLVLGLGGGWWEEGCYLCIFKQNEREKETGGLKGGSGGLGGLLGLGFIIIRARAWFGIWGSRDLGGLLGLVGLWGERRLKGWGGGWGDR